MNPLEEISCNSKIYSVLSSIDQNVLNNTNLVKTYSYLQDENENEKSYVVLSNFNPIDFEISNNMCEFDPNQDLLAKDNRCFTLNSNLNQEDNLISIESSLIGLNEQTVRIGNNYEMVSNLFANQVNEPPSVNYTVESIMCSQNLEILNQSQNLISKNVQTDDEIANQNLTYQIYTNIQSDNQICDVLKEKPTDNYQEHNISSNKTKDENIKSNYGYSEFRPYKCDIKNCNKYFRSVADVAKHKKNHILEKHKYDLNRHMRIHSENPRPFKCEHCGRAFCQKKSLRDHIKAHSEETEQKLLFMEIKNEIIDNSVSEKGSFVYDSFNDNKSLVKDEPTDL